MVGVPPKSSVLIGFSIIFTIHFEVPLFLEISIYKLHHQFKKMPKHNFLSLEMQKCHSSIFGVADLPKAQS